ncbi:MAG: sulfurtransferase TusA family protein [Pseudomonadota bacterium]
MTEPLDFRHLRCPMPLLRLKQALHALPAHTVVEVLTADAGATRDIPAFLRQAGHRLESQVTDAAGVTHFRLVKMT